MFRFKIHFKMLILLLVVLMSFTISASTRTESLSQQTERLYGTNETIRIDPQPELGFYYPYYLYIPDNTKTDTLVYMLVEPNNSGKRTDDFTIHEQKAKTKLERGYPNQIASRMGIPLLMPVFPHLASQTRLYLHELDRDSLLVKKGQLYRVDLQLIAMIQHARKELAEKGLMVHDKILLDGFSASGLFVNRFTFLHPDYVKAVACGGVNSTPMLPFAKLEGEKLIYPIGVYDVQELIGSQFRYKEYKRIPQYIYQGRLDPLDTLPYLLPEEARLVKKILHEKMMPERWEVAKHWYKKAKLPAQFVVYNETYHEIKDEIVYDIVRFFQANMGEKFVPIQPYLYAPVVRRAHIKEILLKDSEKIPAFCSLKDYHFIISIDDWDPAQNYEQLNRFISNAGFAFEVIDIESRKVIFEISKENKYGTLSSGKGDFQGYAVKLRKEQIERLKEGKKYTIKPINNSNKYKWLNYKEVSFVWKEFK
jgi:hypothetical protein